MKLIYINCDNSSVVEAQVLALLKYYARSANFEKITLLQGFSNETEKAALAKKLRGFDTNVFWFRRWPGYTYFNSLALHSITKVLNQINLDRETIIHARGELYGAILKNYVGRSKNYAKLIVDIRGVGFEEVEKYYSLNPLLRKNKRRLFVESFAKLKHTALTVVSSAFQTYLVETHKFNATDICIHPNIASENFTFDLGLRNKMRAELEFGDNQLVAICSSGGGAAWQKDKELINPLIKLGVKVINLSSAIIDNPGVINKIVKFDDVPSYLAAADIAILWRDNHIVNNVASPSKFSEFACMGLWTIHNGTVQTARNYINNTSAGIIVKSPDEITQKMLNSVAGYDRADYSTKGRMVFGVENVASSYIQTYKKVLNGLPVSTSI